MTGRAVRRTVALLAALAALMAIVFLERADRDLVRTQLFVGATPVTLLHPRGEAHETYPMVVIAHGFGGSRQMMSASALTLARAGMAVLSMDLAGHGRNPVPLSTDVTHINGTTADLVEEVVRVAQAGLDLPQSNGSMALLGHSMATDVIVRAARILGISDVVAISMYSKAITPDAPQRLLALSGQWEDALRANARDALRMVDPTATEGETAISGEVERRAAVAPGVGHVGVLWSAMTLIEARDWLVGGDARPAGRTGLLLAVALGGLLATAHLIVPELGRKKSPGHLSTRRFGAACLIPIVPAIAAALLIRIPIAGIGGFASLVAFLGVWGGLQLAILKPPWRRVGPGSAAYLIWALVFALTLDRYGASFLPTGPRIVIAAALLPATLAAILADTWLVHRGTIWQGLVARALLILSLAMAMMVAPDRLGLMFTVIPVSLLFFLVYGTVARRVARREGPTGPALAMGATLAWALAASTPLFTG